MNDLRKAAEMALEALENVSPDTDTLVEVEPHIWEYRSSFVIQALRQALDLQTAIEKGTKAWADVPNATEWVDDLRGYDTPEVTPEGWVKIDEVRHFLDSVGCGTIYKTAGEGRVPLYAAPYTKLDTTAGVLHKEWVGLTDDEIAKYWGDAFAGNTQYVQKFARIIEAKLKEKNVPQP